MFRGDGNALMAVSGDVSVPAAVVGSSRLKPLPRRRCATWWATFVGKAATAGLPGRWFGVRWRLR